MSTSRETDINNVKSAGTTADNGTTQNDKQLPMSRLCTCNQNIQRTTAVDLNWCVCDMVVGRVDDMDREVVNGE